MWLKHCLVSLVLKVLVKCIQWSMSYLVWLQTHYANAHTLFCAYNFSWQAINIFHSRTISVLLDQRQLKQMSIMSNRLKDSSHLASFSSPCTVSWHTQILSKAQTLVSSHFLEITQQSLCFDSRHMSRRGRVCWLISHLADDVLWSERPYHDKVSEMCTFNYRS